MRDISTSIVNDIMVNVFDINTAVAEIMMKHWAGKKNKTTKFYSHLEYDFLTGKEPILRINEDKT